MRRSSNCHTCDEQGRNRRRDMKSRYWVSRVVAAVVAALALSVWVQAHAKLEKSIPAAGATVTAAPAAIMLYFNETPDLKVSKVEVTGPSGKVELGPAHSMADKDIMAAVKGAMGNGKYTVA